MPAEWPIREVSPERAIRCHACGTAFASFHKEYRKKACHYHTIRRQLSQEAATLEGHSARGAASASGEKRTREADLRHGGL